VRFPGRPSIGLLRRVTMNPMNEGRRRTDALTRRWKKSVEAAVYAVSTRFPKM
jgi:hypothetical protein